MRQIKDLYYLSLKETLILFIGLNIAGFISAGLAWFLIKGVF